MLHTIVVDLVASAQRCTVTRHAVHLIIAREIESMALEPDLELALRDAAYKLIFPEYAHRLAGEVAPGGADHA